MISLKIDDQPVEVPAGTTVLQACRMAGIHIPTLCDHPALKPYGGCRLCVVEVEGMRTLQASCTLPVYPNMVVHTNTSKVRKSREFVLELIFSERNHFCMYCQKTGGDCELQNAAYGEEMTHWPLQPNWKPYLVDASHPYFVFDHNRCILCRRCVRACAELVGNFTLGLENRGASSLIVADYGVPVGDSSCIRCGTCVQVCPTGALIDRASAYQGLEKNTDQVESICAGCSVGCGIELVVRDNRLVRIDGNWESPVNGGVLCEMGHYLALDEDRPRLTTPLVRKNGALQPASWNEALYALANHLAPLSGKNGDGVAALASTRLPAEALYAFNELFCSDMGSTMVATLEENLTTAIPDEPALRGSLDSLKTADCVLAIGVDLAASHPVAGFFIKRNRANGTQLIVIDPYENGMEAFASYALRPAPGSDELLLNGILATIANLGLDRADLPAGIDPAKVDLNHVSLATGLSGETIAAVAKTIASARKPVIVIGKGITRLSAGPALKAVYDLARSTGAVVLNPAGKANSLAAHAYGLDRPFHLNGHKAVYLALGDDQPTLRLAEYMDGVEFLAVQASYQSPLTERADIVLPVMTWAEQDGHFVNLEGRIQAAHQALAAPAGVWSNTAVFEAIAARLGFDLSKSWEVPLANRTPVAG